MTAMHFYGWEKGLKTGQYYLRSRPARDAIKFTVNMETLLAATEQKDEKEILKALDKVKESKKGTGQQNGSITKQTAAKGSINLGRKTSKPAGGFTEEADVDSDQKKQKTDSSLKGKEEDASSDMFQCENCGS